MRAWLALLVLVTAPRPPRLLAAQDTVRFTPKVGHPTFAVREPVLRIKPGTVLISNTMFGPYYTEEGGAVASLPTPGCAC
ncbi:MAG TPA: hypothetical protein VGQ06_09075 [Gemmatimonadales bacterium]|jgi:hypothetical protein|nr:hypothetical protein [Gemmatimonadales bacterium]